MLTRAYDTIMASLQVPMILNQNVDFNNSSIDDSVLNCKDYNGNVITVVSASGFHSTGINTSGLYNYIVPFSYWDEIYSYLLPDEDELDPTYEDYSVSNGSPIGWTVNSVNPSFEKTYDQDTKEIICTVKILWQNTSGAAKTVYGVKVRGAAYPRRGYNSATSSGGVFCLLCREHFVAPVVVEDQGVIALTFTWRVGRAGLVSATAAAAK